MKVHDSGMPEEEYWESLFDVPAIMDFFDVGRFRDVAECGCGYGTFTLPVARTVQGSVFVFDIEPEMVARTLERGAGLPLVGSVRDVMEEGFGVEVEAVLLFNILHGQHADRLVQQAAEALTRGGEALVIHWRLDMVTPRGPAPHERSSPQQIAAWALAAGLEPDSPTILPPWHFAMRLRKV